MRLEPKWQRKLAMQMHSGGTHVGGALDTMTLSHVLLLRTAHYIQRTAHCIQRLALEGAYGPSSWKVPMRGSTTVAALTFMVRSQPRAHQHTLLLSLALALALALALDVQPVVPIRLAIYCGRKRKHHTRDKPTPPKTMLCSSS